MMNTPILRLGPGRTFLRFWSGIMKNTGTSYWRTFRFQKWRKEIPELFDGIEDGSKRIRQIILNMKNYARKNTLDMNQKVDLREVIRAAVGLLSHQIKKSTGRDVRPLSQRLTGGSGEIDRGWSRSLLTWFRMRVNHWQTGQRELTSKLFPSPKKMNLSCVLQTKAPESDRNIWILFSIPFLPPRVKREGRDSAFPFARAL